MTALTGLATHRDAVWIASAMTEGDTRKSRERGGRAFEIDTAGGVFKVRLVESEPDAYDRFYNVVANPMLWFIQHYLWDLSNAPDIRQNEVLAFEEGYKVVNEDLAEAVIAQIEGVENPIVMVHDYHLYTLPAVVRAARPDVFLHHFVHIPWTQPDAWRVLPKAIREEIFNGVLSNDIVGFHTRSYRWNFLQCCRDLMDYEVDFERGFVCVGEREVWVRAYPLPIDYEATRKVAASERTAGFEARAAAPPARAHHPARRPRRPVEERPARLHGLRPVPRRAPGVPRERHVHRPAHAVADGRARVPGVPRADRGAWWRSSTTVTARRTGCRSSSSCATTSRRRSRRTSTTT